jgi:signal transduction histidine kinase
VKVEQLFNEEMKEKGIGLNLPRQCDMQMEADRQMMEQVMINLVKNSMEAVQNTADPQIDLACYQDRENRICLQVDDNGEGIPPDKLDQVFIPFFTTREKGSGIGLSLCRQIIRSHQGSTYIESEPGKGTRVIITL